MLWGTKFQGYLTCAQAAAVHTSWYMHGYMYVCTVHAWVGASSATGTDTQRTNTEASVHMYERMRGVALPTITQEDWTIECTEGALALEQQVIV